MKEDVSSYWMTLRRKRILKIEMETLDLTLERNCFARGRGTLVRQTTG